MRGRRARRVLVVAALVLGLTPLASAPGPVLAERAKPKPGSAEPSEFVEGELLVKFKKDAAKPERDELLAKHAAKVKAEVDDIDVQVVSVPNGKEREQADKLKKENKVEFVELNGLYEAVGAPNDPKFGEQWGFKQASDHGIDFVPAYEADTTTSSTIAIAILDTGIKSSHEDLSGKVTKSKSYAGGSTDDRHGHGTHVAGTAAAHTNNGKGGAGTCPNCKLYNVKVLGDNGSGSWSAIANGINWAANNGAKVINMSFGGYSSSLTLQNAVNNAWNKGVVLVAAAGNDGQNWGFYPAAYDNVIAVAATNASGEKASFSNYGGNWVDVAAPGEGILSTVRGGGYQSWSGTSMASPHVAGIAGLVWSKSDCSSKSCVRDRIEDMADDTDESGYWIHGKVNACWAVKNGTGVC